MFSLGGQIFIAFILMMMTGFISNIIWWILYRKMKKQVSKIACNTLRCVCLFYIVPIGYLLINLIKRDGYLQGDQLWQLNFRVTETMGVSMCVFLILWMGITIFKVGKRFILLRQYNIGNLPEESMQAVKVFKEAKSKLKINGFVSIHRNDMVKGPRLHGVVHGRIVLPFHMYTNDQLKVIYSHELMHFKHHDLFYKYCSVLVSGMLWMFKGVSEFRNKMLDELCEYHCDLSTIVVLNEDMSARQYFNNIVESTKKRDKRGEHEHLIVELNKDSLQIKRRIHYIERYEDIEQKSSKLVFLVTLLFVILNMTISYITGYGMAELNDLIYQNTEKINVIQRDEYLKNVLLFDAMNYTVSNEISMINEGMLTTLDYGNIIKMEWQIESNSSCISDFVHMKKGQYITINGVIMPDTENCWIGIISERGDCMGYMEVKEIFEGEAVVQKDGEYQIFIQNKGEKDIFASVNVFMNIK